MLLLLLRTKSEGVYVFWPRVSNIWLFAISPCRLHFHLSPFLNKLRPLNILAWVLAFCIASTYTVWFVLNTIVPIKKQLEDRYAIQNYIKHCFLRASSLLDQTLLKAKAVAWKIVVVDGVIKLRNKPLFDGDFRNLTI